jgi:hypothetical protein
MLIIYNILLGVRFIILGDLNRTCINSFLLLFHQRQSISTNYIEPKSNGSTRTNMPMPTCPLCCPLLPLQDYLLQGWFSSFPFFLLGFLTHHHCSFCYSLLLLPQKWWTPFILLIRVFPFFIIFSFTLS